MSERVLGRWHARLVRRATTVDVAAVAVLVLLALLTVVSGRRARDVLSPRAAVETGRMLDDLELPTRLLDAPLADPSGTTQSLFARIHGRRTVVAFYAPWCGPCQKELPEVAALVDNNAQLIIVISASDVQDTHRKLANLGLTSVGFVIDVNNRLTRQAHVTQLPTTFVITPRGNILMRTSGYSPYGLFRVRQWVYGGATTPDGAR